MFFGMIITPLPTSAGTIDWGRAERSLKECRHNQVELRERISPVVALLWLGIVR